MPVQGQEFPVGSMATVPGWGAVNNTGVVPLFPTDLMFNDRMEIVGDEECAQMYEGREKDISQQLTGMVNYIFSDKTGTLTQNIMEF